MKNFSFIFCIFFFITVNAGELKSLNESFKINKLQYKFLDRKSDLILVDEK